MSYSNNQIAFTGNRPMCGVGVQVDEFASREEIIEKAGLNWSIDEQPQKYTHNDIKYIDKSKKLLINSSNGDLLHVSSNRFKPVQPSTILNSFFDIVDSLDFQMEVIGQIDNGKKIFARAKAPNNLEINGEKIEGYLTIATGNDGSMSTIANIGGNCLACMNETPMLFAGKQAHRTRHSTSFNPEKMILDLNLKNFDSAWSDFETTVQKLVDVRVDSVKAMELIHRVIGTGKPINEESTKTINNVQQVYTNMINAAGAGIAARQGSLWGVFNGLSYYTDHQLARNENNRAKGLLMGDGLKLKNNALEILGLEAEKAFSDNPQAINAMELLGMPN